MPKRQIGPLWEAWRCALIAATATVLVTWLRLLLDPYLGEHLPYLIFTLSVAVAARCGGWKTGLATILLAVLTATYLFTEPRYYVSRLDNPHAMLEMVTFVLVGAALVALLETERRLRRRLQFEHLQRLRAERELDAARRLDSIGLLAGGVAHDFNNLLTVILGSGELLRAKLPNDVRLDSISRAAAHAAELVRQLLRVARREQIRPTQISINEEIRQGEHLLRRVVPGDVALTFALRSKDLPLMADPLQLQQVLQNLVANAKDAVQSGGKISVETEDVSVDRAFCKEHPDVAPGHYVVLRVSDDGQGLSDEVRERIFEPFFSTKSNGRGTGLGLAVVYGIMKQAKGHILVHTKQGVGTAFEVYWPRVATPPAHPLLATPTSEPLAPAGPLRVLLVDDDEGVLEVTASMLRSLGHEVVAQAGPAAALKTLSASDAPTFDVLVTDVVMPWMNGRELANQVGQLRPGTPVVFISGYNDDVVLNRGVREPDGSMLKKPFAKSDLERALRRATAAISPSREPTQETTRADGNKPVRGMLLN